MSDIKPAIPDDGVWREMSVELRHEPRQPKRTLWVSFWADGLELREAGIWKFQIDVADIPALIAVANASLKPSDPRKITRLDLIALRETVRIQETALQQAVGGITDNYFERLKRLADALESYLPPEET